MRRFAFLLLLPSAVLADGGALLGSVVTNDVTNVVSNVQTVRGWTRQKVGVRPDGTLVDPSGSLVSAALEAERGERARNAQVVTEAARDGMTNALARVYALTNRVPDASVSLRLSMKPPAANTNFYAYIVSERTDGTNDVATYYFSRQLLIPPKVQRRYRDGTYTAFVEGGWLNWSTNGVDVTDSEGVTWEGCNELRFVRPAWAVGVPAKPNRHPALGHPATGLDFAGATVYVDGRLTLTGYVTNSVDGVRAYFDNGVFKVLEEVETE